MSNEELHDFLKENLEVKFKEWFDKGLMAGWNACIYSIDKQIANITSAKAIKALIKARVAEADARVKMRENE